MNVEDRQASSLARFLNYIYKSTPITKKQYRELTGIPKTGTLPLKEVGREFKEWLTGFWEGDGTVRLGAVG